MATLSPEERLARYAELAVRVGANVQEGQTVVVLTQIEHAPLARAITRAAYEAGAKYVEVEYRDQHVRKAMIELGPDEALAYTRRGGNKMTWYSTANSPFGSDVGAPPGGGFAVNVFLRAGDTVYRTWHTNGRGTEQLTHSFALIDLLPYGRQEEWQDSPEGWPQSPTYSGWASSEDIAACYGPGA